MVRPDLRSGGRHAHLLAVYLYERGPSLRTLLVPVARTYMAQGGPTNPLNLLLGLLRPATSRRLHVLQARRRRRARRPDLDTGASDAGCRQSQNGHGANEEPERGPGVSERRAQARYRLNEKEADRLVR